MLARIKLWFALLILGAALSLASIACIGPVLGEGDDDEGGVFGQSEGDEEDEDDEDDD